LLTVAVPNDDGIALLFNYPVVAGEPATTGWNLTSSAGGPDEDKLAARKLAQDAGWSTLDQWAWDEDRSRWSVKIQIKNVVES